VRNVHLPALRATPGLDVPREALMDSIRRVHAGETSVPGYLVAKLANRVSGETLSRREIEVLKLMASIQTRVALPFRSPPPATTTNNQPNYQRPHPLGRVAEG
jgi:hypothetical protein